tara:strand:- start:170 stop:487 length:318 start_codon:yes stop_codon:yes gene_type:complete
MANGIDDVFANFLEDEPRAAFFGTLRTQPGFRDTPGERRQAQDIYQSALSDFYGQLGQDILSGQTPNMTFTDFLQDFPFTERFAQMGRQYNQLSRYRPRTRFLYY